MLIETGIALGALVFLWSLFGRAGAAGPPGEPGEPAPRPDGADSGETTGGKRGRGPSGAPRPAPGGSTVGTPPAGRSYEVPLDFDPDRGLWVSPDCEVVVEAPGFWCGLEYERGTGPLVPLSTRKDRFGLPLCGQVIDASYEAPTLQELFAASATAGAVGCVDYWRNQGKQPEEIAARILSEVAPFCLEVPDQWGEGLQAWWESTLLRIVGYLEELELEGEA